ncbi:MAG: iron export ABC transporter permease subunit FetB [Clostridia bacterium]|nr:iron export ABC transporter permease subunit FetB [Clostridia bacterium]
MDNVIDLSFWQMMAAYIFLILLIIIVKLRHIPREKEILISSVRMTLQLIMTGYILTYFFQNSHPIYTLLLLTVMETFAVYNIFKRVKLNLSIKIKKIIALSMVSGTLISLIYFILVVINLLPWYEPRYFIPIAGMLIGNSMTGISLGVNKLIDGMVNQKDMIESALMLGATPKTASKHIINNSFDSAILPTINSMVGMGIVFLPGMMTGQILSGISPLIAIKYQIAIMLTILGSVSLTVIIFLNMSYKIFFNEHDQLDLDSYLENAKPK